jgi:hypothetical protein
MAVNGDYPFGLVEGDRIYDNFLYEQAENTESSTRVCSKVCSRLVDRLQNDKRCIAICVPCQNETLDELMRTVSSLLENIEFLQRKVFYALESFVLNLFTSRLPYAILRPGCTRMKWDLRSSGSLLILCQS